MEYIVLAFGGGVLLCAIIDRLHYRKLIGDAYQVGALDGAMAVTKIVAKRHPNIMNELQDEVIEFDKGKVL